MLKDAPIIILDEATANVDPENEAELQEAIKALTAGKTLVMIAHRMKTTQGPIKSLYWIREGLCSGAVIRS